ncbi:ATP-binding protein [Halomonas alkalisoli]|uniref:ATP-binding protein n=1 Tax=Halomonas alkalisoli TaxID=2907158 RepID=UPI001F3E9764|nr:ATP-binding protein [Halomonas alkalisoli]MCE9682503.1 ATP-binding protein [Halomonas alkalisoli]
MALITTNLAVQSLREEASRHLSHEVTNKAIALTHFLEQVESELRFLSVSAGRAAFGGEEQLAQLQKDYLAFAENYPFIDQLRVLAENGSERLRIERRDGVVRGLPAERLQNKSDRYYLHEAMRLRPGEIYMSPVDLNEEHGEVELPERPVVRLATPLAGEGEEKAGLLVVNLSAHFFLDSIQRLSSGTGGTAYLLQSNGLYLKRDGRPENIQSFDIRPLDELGSQLPDGLLSEIRAGAQGTRQLDKTIVAFAPVSRQGDFLPHSMRWQIMVELPKRQLIASLLNVPLLYSALAITVLFALLAGYMVTRRIFTPLAELGRQTERIAGGELSSRTDVQGEDEISILAQRFNYMAERVEQLYWNVEDRRQRLDRQVRERTAELEQERHYLSLIISQVADGILVLDANDRIELANPAAQALLATVTQDIEGVPLSELWRSWSPDTLINIEDGCHLDWVLEGRVLAVHIGPRSPAGVTDGRVLVCRDVTLEREMQVQRRELDRHIFHTEKMNALGELTVGIAHEVGNPLAGMKVVIQAVLSRDDIPERVARQLARVEREVDRLTSFVRSFRGFSAPHELNIRPCSLDEMVDDVLLWTRKEASAQGITIGYRRCAPDAPDLLADPNMLKQVLLNLVINAIQAMSSGGGRITISRCMRSITGPDMQVRGVICVEDSGIGIPPDVQRRIFEPFYTTRPQGSGLGLAIVRKIAEQHGVEIRVHSPPEGGARFELLWPLDKSATEEPIIACIKEPHS